MGKSRQSGGGGQRRATTKDMYESSLKEHFGDVLSDNEIQNFADSIIEHNFSISGFVSHDGSVEIVLKSNDPNNNDELHIEKGFLAKLSDSKFNTMMSVLNEYEDIPEKKKNGKNSSNSELNGQILFTSRRGKGGLYTGGLLNGIIIPASTLKYKRGSDFSLSTTLIHEMTHRADFEGGVRYKDASLIGGSKIEGSKLGLSYLTKFSEISSHEVASAYSRQYKYTKTGRLTTKDSKVNLKLIK